MFAFLGAAGFGIGGAIGGPVWVSNDAPYLGFAIMGALGGLFIAGGRSGQKNAGKFGLASAVIFNIAFMFSFLLVLAVLKTAFEGFMIGAIGGSIGGFAIGYLILRDFKLAVLTALAAGFGFGLAMQITWGITRELGPRVIAAGLSMALWGAWGGAALGMALDYFKKQESLEEVESV